MPSAKPTTIGSPKPSPSPTPAPTTPIGSIRFGSSIDVAGVLQPADHFHAGETAVWIFRSGSPPATEELRFVVHQVLADGREFEHWAQAIQVEDPSASTLVGMADLATYAHGGAGTYRMRYLRGDEILAEGLFELAQ